MRHTIKKQLDEQGYTEVFIDGKRLNFSTAQDISRDLLKQLDVKFKCMDGIFTDGNMEQEIIFGKYEKTFHLENIIFENDIVLIREAIRKNIFTVQEWLQSCKDKARTETITLDI